MYKVGAVTGLSGALGLMSGSILAAEKTENHNEGVSVDELSLYTSPPQNPQWGEERARRQVEEGVATVRKLAEPYTTWGQGVYGAVKPRVDSVVQFGQDSYSYLKNPSAEFYPRAGVIGFAGVLGLFLARGSRVKKLIYPTALMAVGASMYYPKEAVTIAKASGDAVYDWALQAYVTAEKLVTGKPAEKVENTKEKPSSGETTV
ncbi:apolipoprotein O, a isoform X2 [Hoplias malabaricus]|uniref:apolipoprotein O, a isoform X2 n=1 Tax=Hoplias malabaricus TaxID=27720 RepID=UPI003461F17E